MCWPKFTTLKAEGRPADLAPNPSRLAAGNVSRKENPLALTGEARQGLVAGGASHIEHGFFMLRAKLADVIHPTPLGLRPSGWPEVWERG